jgi:cytochrome P450
VTGQPTTGPATDAVVPAVTWVDEHGGYWSVTGDAAIRQITSARDGFSSVPTVHIPPSGLAERGVRIYALESDDPHHRRERAVLRDAVGLAPAKTLEPRIRAVAVGLLRSLDWERPVDLAEDYAYRLPLDVVSGIVGVPVELAGELRSHTNTLLFRRGTSTEAMAAAERIFEIASQTIEARRGAPRGDWLDELLTAAPRGTEPLGVHDDAVRAVVALITGGHHSTSRAIGSLLAHLLTEPGLRDELVTRPDRIAEAGEEALRLHTPLPSFSRTATSLQRIGATDIAPGERALLHYDVANLGAEVYERPDRFELDRPRHEHLAFGWGVHRCVGMHLARAEMAIAVEELLRLAPDVTLVEPVTWIGPAEPKCLLVRSASAASGAEERP